MPWEDILKQLPSFAAAMLIAIVLLRVIRDLYERYITDLKERLKEALESARSSMDLSRQLAEKITPLVDEVKNLRGEIDELQREMQTRTRTR